MMIGGMYIFAYFRNNKLIQLEFEEPEPKCTNNETENIASDSFQCMICTDPLASKSPKLSSCCQQMLCEECVKNWFSTKTTCPFC